MILPSGRLRPETVSGSAKKAIGSILKFACQYPILVSSPPVLKFFY